MKIVLRIFVLAVFSVLVFFALSGEKAGTWSNRSTQLVSPPVDEPGIPTTSNAKTALRVLKKNCGSCHQSSLKTAKPKALRVFDLDKERWHEPVQKKHVKGISQRIGKTKGVNDFDREATKDFLSCIQHTGSSGSPTVC